MSKENWFKPVQYSRWEILLNSIRLFLIKTRLLPRHILAELLIHSIKFERVSLVSKTRLRNLYRLCSRKGLPFGSFVECGVAKGGCVSILSFAASKSRPVWGFDSFEGMPDLTAEDENDGQSWVGLNCSGPDGLQRAQATLKLFGVNSNNVTLVKGWFENTLPGRLSVLDPIAILRLDNDWYKSTRYCLDMLYDLVIPGGYIIIDDYYAFTGCRKAVDEFRAERGIIDPLFTTESHSEAFWKKSNPEINQGPA